ncbi:MAG TPA: transcription termination/antitermination NusG family protein [Gemmatimonadota bacterium]|nr:transcription termination/antitermination NusG family protein [Gemmatimonadota bacterium]
MPILKREPDVYPEDLFSRDQPDLPWRVAYLHARRVKALARFLRERRLAFYLPQQEKEGIYGGRRRLSHLPLFPGYVFIKTDAVDRNTVYQSNQVVRILDVEDQGLLDRQLRHIWALQQGGALLVPHPYLGPGDEVKITHGPFRGLTGTVIREKGRTRLVVSVTFLRQAVAVEVDRDLLAPAEQSRRDVRRKAEPASAAQAI